MPPPRKSAFFYPPLKRNIFGDGFVQGRAGRIGQTGDGGCLTSSHAQRPFPTSRTSMSQDSKLMKRMTAGPSPRMGGRLPLNIAVFIEVVLAIGRRLVITHPVLHRN